MTPADTAADIAAQAVLAALPAWAFGFALVLARLSAACMLLPGIGEAELPATIRAAFALALTALLLPVLQPELPAEPASVLAGFAMVFAETATGLWFGWLARLPLLALPLAGQLAASLLGLANVLQPDPTLGPQTTALSRLYGVAAPVLVLASGLYALPLAALAGSYRLIPAGQLLPAADSAASAVTAVAASFALGARLAAPFIAAGIVWQVGLGLLSRLVPQLQVYFAATPGQILGGLLLVGLLAATLLAAWQSSLGASFRALPGL
jgi:flagellar biosynthetic protein FliR